ncbi:hypothetical protein [Lysobacter sp. HDW10]|uniref:hypothetical protein n=1 Tax=Lysobacter sp. HDW10 TaxID=2714936 RepID=UPI001F0F25B4|nr:hypothetical protein [Lysobacter sp. HDW10]
MTPPVNFSTLLPDDARLNADARPLRRSAALPALTSFTPSPSTVAAAPFSVLVLGGACGAFSALLRRFRPRSAPNRTA